MTEIPGGDPPICDSCNNPIVGPVIRVGVERFCKSCKENTVMAGRKLTIEDFPLKTEGTDRCWILGCEAGQKARGLCRSHYDKARNAGVWDTLVAQIDARSESPGDRAERGGTSAAILRLWAAAIGASLGEAPEGEQAAQNWASAQWQEYEKWWKDREYRAACAAERQADEVGIALSSMRRLADELTAVDQALGPYRLEATGGNRVLAIEALTAPAGEVLLSEANLRERYDRLNEIGHAESLIAGLSEPLHEALWAALEEQKFRVLRVCP